MVKKDTLLTTLGRNPQSHDWAVNPPEQRASTIIFPTLKDFEDAQTGKTVETTYGIYGTSTARHLMQALATLEGGDKTLLYPSGLAAITGSLLAFLRQGDHLLVPDSVYGPTRRFCDSVLRHYGVETEYYDPLIGGDIASLIRDNTRVIFTESPGSLTFEVQDIPAITAAAKQRGVITMLDNTWASPLCFQPFQHGIDISIQALTKYVGGHSDLLMGAVICKETHYKKLFNTSRWLGNAVSPSDCALALRGLRTLAARLEQHETSALALANWLKDRPEVTHILHPAFEECPGHEYWKRDFTGATGLFSVLFKPFSRNALAAMVDNLQVFAMGYSWGGYESLIIPFNPKNDRTVTHWSHDGVCLRIYAGLENVEDLKQDLEDGLRRLNRH